MTTPATWIAASCAAAIVAALGVGSQRFTSLPARTTVTAPRGARAARWRRLPRRPRRDRAVTDDVVAAWCDDAARRLRSGASLTRALLGARCTDLLDDHLAPVRLAVDRGATLGDALLRAASPTTGLALALGVARACAQLGGPAAEPLDRVAAVLRGRVADAAERHAQSAQARSSAVVLTILPVVMLAVLCATSPSVRTAAASPPGVVCVLAGGVLNLTGWRWMRRMIGAGR